MWSDILHFQTLFYSKDDVSSPVVDYLADLIAKDSQMANKAIYALRSLPKKAYLNQDIKVLKIGKHKFFELRVKSNVNICRFFYIVENPNFIILYGFTKKSQKTDKRDLNQGVQNLEDYLHYKKTIKSNKFL